MLPFRIERPRTVNEAINAAAAGGRYIVGGTTLYDLMREEVERPERLVDINGLPLYGVSVDNGAVVIGALTKMSDVAANPDILHMHPIVSETLVEGASPQLRNMASIGGNLLQRVRCPYFRMLDAACNKRAPGTGCSAIDGMNGGTAIFGTSSSCIATHPSDLAVTLVALDATMKVRGPKGERIFPVSQLYRMPGTTPHLEHTLMPGELIIEVRIPAYQGRRTGRYLKVRDRSSYEFAVVSSAAILELNGGTITQACVAVGGVGTVPWRMPKVEAALTGKPASREVFEQAAAVSLEGHKALPGNHHKADLLPRTIVRSLELARDAA
ncbi:xanthine dehydrogenase family protein subunit M [uncultured Ferrovibrio sp.]|jgi:Aerobic-type carbon monoxide dehydrogenase, middle subunit CoxM/CutM homologs|uniref:FAD binding domain-containing protein n=1 Tax=uncultured Ferrovibrio sp. TaxID=1576913 RepID=UPI002620FCF1|nr:xanthine dehydrogenase family protein subunit M [uncultured Ferrovibrio sp.]